MANRYLRASGNWNGAVWAATSGGAAGSAATPTAGDAVYISANFTVTLTADAICGALWHTNGQLSLSSYKLTITCEEMMTGDGGFESTGTTTRTLDLGSGHLELANMDDYVGALFNLSGSNLNFIAGTSLITMNVWGGSFAPYSGTFYTADKAFNDVRINFYNSSGTPASAQLNIAGSPTFRLLDIRSTNSAAHTVNTDGNLYMQKFVAIGSSPSNRLTFNDNYVPPGGPPLSRGQICISHDGTCYGQNLDMSNATAASGSGNLWYEQLYIGSGSIGSEFILQDPPKISTLVDPLTTAPASNDNWEFPYGYPAMITSGIGGGGYDLSTGQMVSTDTYDMVDAPYVFEQSRFGARFTKFLINSNSTVQISTSDDGVTWDILHDAPIPDAVHFRSVRLGVTDIDNDIPPFPSEPIGSINPSFAIDIDTNSASSSTSISTPSISRTASLSIQGHGVGTSMSTTDIQSVIVLDTDSIGTSTSMSEPSMVLIRGILPNSMSIGVSANNLGLLLKAGVLPDNMEIVTTSSIPSISGDIFIFTDDMLVGLNEDEVSVAALRNMDVDAMSIIPAILATAVQIGYPTGDINADNIYAIGSMREGEYGIATINNNQIYEVVEQDGI